MFETNNPADQVELKLPSSSGVDSSNHNQIPLSVFFELTGVVAIIFMFSGLIGPLAAVGLGVMAISILFRQGVAATVSFIAAMCAAQLDPHLGGAAVCVGLGVMIAFWPIARAAVIDSIKS